MKDSEFWRPTKYEVRGGRLRGSLDSAHLAVGSRLAGDLAAEWYESACPRYVSGRLLDLGCGEVPLFSTYRPYATEIVTLDWAHSPHPTRHADVMHDLEERLPFEDAAFGTVVLADVLEHVRKPQFLLGEIARVLQIGGHLIASTPFYYPVHEAPHDYFRYTQFGLTYHVELSGLRVVELESMGGSAEIVVDLLAKHFAAIGYRVGPAISVGLQKVAYRLARTRFGRAFAKRSSGAFPFGHFVAAVKHDAATVGSPQSVPRVCS